MTKYVRQGMTKNEIAKNKRPVMRVLSYLLQEAEAVSRNAKIEWCDTNGIQVLNLQHDGMVGFGMPAGMDSGMVAAHMAAAASVACGYQVEVEAEQLPLGAHVVD
jgi:hypothetical protein